MIRKPGEEEHFRCTVEHRLLFNDGLCRLEGDTAEDGHLLPLGRSHRSKTLTEPSVLGARYF